ncbi:MAG: flagellar motor protein MotB [Acetanaerobacterium sp.]
MARKRRQSEDDGGSGAWLNTYADMVTLLLTFFVMLYSMSTIDAEDWEFLKSALSNIGISTSQLVVAQDLSMEGDGQVGSTGTGIGDSDVAKDSDETIDVETLYKLLSNYVDTMGEGEMKESIELQHGKNYVLIRFTDNVFFNPDRANLRTEGKEALLEIGKGIKLAQDSIGVIRIEGHTASVLEDDNYRVDDRELSSDRANAVLKFLEESNGIASEKLSSLGYGKYRPIADNSTPEGRKKNRRVEILVVEKNIDIEDHESLKELVARFFGQDKYTVDDSYEP